MRFLLLCVGRARNQALAEVIAGYEARAARYWPLEVSEVREERAHGGDVDAERVRSREGDRLVGKAGSARVVACDVNGSAPTSEGFANWMQEARESARDVAFLIGGAFGLAPTLSARAEMRLSLSPLTLPHELARLILAEQLYRAGTIVRGEPYHK